ncbi:MAG TPA: holo-ACP synthase [Luteolibacter sp.]|nr:holo-ACP synthase [Luteolibacter sp.]
MGIHGIGIDVVEIERIRAAIDKHGESYLAKLFTPAERAYCDGHRDPAAHYAARFAAKEAVSKAMGTGIGKHAGLHDLEVGHAEGGGPIMLLHGAAKDFAKAHGITQILISLTHARDHAAANAIALTAS